VADVNAALAGHPAVASEAAGGARRARILVVDDDLAIAGTIKRYLQQYDIEVVDCIETAIRFLEHRTCDLVLVDRLLPDGLGGGVVAAVRSRHRSLPVIMMSGAHEPQRSHDRADDFIEKPFVREALVEKIERLLAAHVLRKQAAQQRRELLELKAHRDREVAVAQTIFERTFARGEFDPARVRWLVLAADRLAGDFVFGCQVDRDRYRWMIGDVTGHTLSSALVTMPLATLFYDTAQQGGEPAGVLAVMERELSTMLPPSMFCVAVLCELDRRAGTLAVWNGGNPDLLIRHASGAVTQIPSSGPPLAADRFHPAGHAFLWHPVWPGDRIFAFSDGLIEIRDAANAMIGFERLLDVVRGDDASTIFDRLVALIPPRVADVGYEDDISLIEVLV